MNSSIIKKNDSVPETINKQKQCFVKHDTLFEVWDLLIFRESSGECGRCSNVVVYVKQV